MAAVSEAEERRRQAQLTAARNQARQTGGRQGQKVGRQAGQAAGSQGAKMGGRVGGAVGQQTGKMAGGFVGKKMGERAAEGAVNMQARKAQLSQAQQASKLAKQVVTGKRDKSKSLVKQGLGEVGARGGQALGQAANFLLPGAGAVLAPVFKRVGRILGEHPGLALLAIVVTSLAIILVLLLPFLTMVIVINSVLSWF